MDNSLKEKGMRLVFLLAACASIIAVALICIFIFGNGVPAIHEIGFVRFLTGVNWEPSKDVYEILPMIIGSIYVTAGAIIIGVPVGILCATFMARFCNDRLHRLLKPAIDLLAGIPSIVYGFFGLTDFKRISVLKPIVGNFDLLVIDNFLLEQAVFITDAVAVSWKIQGNCRIQKASH